MPRLTQAGAIALAEASDWGTLLKEGKDLTVKYGSYQMNALRQHSTVPQSVWSVDVWAITVGGMNFPSSVPALPSAYGPQPVQGVAHFLTVLVDDKAGQILLAQEND